MFTFETDNSIYTVRQTANGMLEVLKTVAINPKSTFNEVGTTRIAISFYYDYNTRLMNFTEVDGRVWHTSPVRRFL